MEIPDHLTCLLRNLYAGQEATVRHVDLLADQGTWNNGLLQVVQTASSWKGVVEAVCCHPAYLTYIYAEYIMRNPGLDEAQAGNKITGRNINNLRYADDITLMAESEEELKSLLIK